MADRTLTPRLVQPAPRGRNWVLKTALRSVADARATELPPAEVNASRTASLGHQNYLTLVMVRCIYDTIGDGERADGIRAGGPTQNPRTISPITKNIHAASSVRAPQYRMGYIVSTPSALRQG